MNNIKIFSAYINDFELPKNKDIYIPIHAGKELSSINLNMIGDNTGDNISSKNPNYCELTALYWIWKNYDLSSVSYIGLSHYRRIFDVNEKLLKNINDYDIILPRKEIFGTPFMSFSLYNQFCYSHNRNDLDEAISIIKSIFPEYTDFIDVLHKRKKIYLFNKGYFYNMFIMRKDIFYRYNSWLFTILEKLETSIKVSNNNYQKRVFGFLSERLLNVFIEKCKSEGLKILEIDIIKK